MDGRGALAIPAWGIVNSGEAGEALMAGSGWAVVVAVPGWVVALVLVGERAASPTWGALGCVLARMGFGRSVVNCDALGDERLFRMSRRVPPANIKPAKMEADSPNATIK